MGATASKVLDQAIENAGKSTIQAVVRLLHSETLPLASPEFIGRRSQRSNGFRVRDFAAPLKEQGEQLI